jgi:hypothetical protein
MGYAEAIDINIVDPGLSSANEVTITLDSWIDTSCVFRIIDIPFKVLKADITGTGAFFRFEAGMFVDSNNYISGILYLYEIGGSLTVTLNAIVKISGSADVEVDTSIAISYDDWYYFRVAIVLDSYSGETDCKGLLYSDAGCRTKVGETAWAYRLSLATMTTPLSVKTTEYYSSMSTNDSFHIQVLKPSQVVNENSVTDFTKVPLMSVPYETDYVAAAYVVWSEFDFPIILIEGDEIYLFDFTDPDEPSLTVTNPDPDVTVASEDTLGDLIQDDLTTLAENWDRDYEIDPLELYSTNPLINLVYIGINLLGNILIIPVFELVTDTIFNTLEIVIINVAVVANIIGGGIKLFTEGNISDIGPWVGGLFQTAVNANINSIMSGFRTTVTGNSIIFSTLKDVVLDLFTDFELLGDYSSFQSLVANAISVVNTATSELLSLETTL